MKSPTYGKRGGLQTLDRGTRNVSNAFGRSTVLTFGRKACGGIALESDSERLVAHMLNLDPDVVSYSAQPFAVELTTNCIARNDAEKDALRARAKRHGSKAVFYTPDFGIAWTTGGHAAIEVKLATHLGDTQYQRKLKLAAQILHGHGCELLQLVMPGNWRHPLRTNLPLLHQAHMRRDLWPKPGVSERILKLHDAGANTVGDFVRGLELDARMAPVLLVSGHVETDLVGQALCFATPARPAFGDLSHLQLVRKLAK